MNMDEAIAYGATIKAAQLSGQNMENQDIKLIDVMPISLGIRDADGDMSVIIPKNSKIPLRKAHPLKVKTEK